MSSGTPVPLTHVGTIDLDLMVAIAEANQAETALGIVVNSRSYIYGPPDVVQVAGDSKLAIFEFVNPEWDTALRVAYIKTGVGTDTETHWELFPTGLALLARQHQHDEQPRHHDARSHACPHRRVYSPQDEYTITQARSADFTADRAFSLPS